MGYWTSSRIHCSKQLGRAQHARKHFTPDSLANSLCPASQPFSPLHSHTSALTSRIERGGPLLGRIIHSPRAANIERSRSPSPPPTRPATARPQWDDSTMLMAPVLQGKRPMSSRAIISQVHPFVLPLPDSDERPSTSPEAGRGRLSADSSMLYPPAPPTARPVTAGHPSPRVRGRAEV